MGHSSFISALNFSSIGRSISEIQTFAFIEVPIHVRTYTCTHADIHIHLKMLSKPLFWTFHFDFSVLTWKSWFPFYENKASFIRKQNITELGHSCKSRLTTLGMHGFYVTTFIELKKWSF